MIVSGKHLELYSADCVLIRTIAVASDRNSDSTSFSKKRDVLVYITLKKINPWIKAAGIRFSNNVYIISARNGLLFFSQPCFLSPGSA